MLIPHPSLHAPRTGYALAKDIVNHVGEPIVDGGGREPLPGRGCRRADQGRLRRTAGGGRHPGRQGGETRRARGHPGQHRRPPGATGRRRRRGDGRRPAPAGIRPDHRTVVLDAAGGQGGHARWDPDDGSLRVYSSTQAATSVRAAIAAKLGSAAAEGRGDRARCRRRFRRQDHAPVAGGDPGPDGRDAARPPGEMDRGPARAFHLLGPRARPGAAHQGRIRRRRKDSRARRDLLARQRRLHPVRHHLPDRHLDPAARTVQTWRLPGRVLLRSTPPR